MATVPFFYQHFHALNGALAAGGTMQVYAAGSPVHKPIYTDWQLLTPRANPMNLDGNGVAPQWFVGPGQVDIKVYDAQGGLIFSALNIDGAAATGSSQYPVPSGPGYLYFDGTTYSWSAVQMDHKVAISSTASADYLQNVVAGSASVTVTPTGNQLVLTANLAGAVGDRKVKTDSADSAPGYLTDKIVSGPGVTLGTLSTGGNDQLVVSCNGTVLTGAGDSQQGTLSQKLVSSATNNVTVHTTAGVQTLTVDSVPSAILDGKVKTDQYDSPDYLVNKIVGSSSVTVTEVVGATRTLQLAAISDHKSLVSPTDSTPATLVEKTIGGTGVSIVALGGSGTNQTLQFSSLGLVAATDPVSGTGDVLSTLTNKLKGGAGITLSKITDPTYGSQIWINANASFMLPYTEELFSFSLSQLNSGNIRQDGTYGAGSGNCTGTRGFAFIAGVSAVFNSLRIWTSGGGGGAWRVGIYNSALQCIAKSTQQTYTLAGIWTMDLTLDGSGNPISGVALTGGQVYYMAYSSTDTTSNSWLSVVNNCSTASTSPVMQVGSATDFPATIGAPSSYTAYRPYLAVSTLS